MINFNLLTTLQIFFVSVNGHKLFKEKSVDQVVWNQMSSSQKSSFDALMSSPEQPSQSQSQDTNNIGHSTLAKSSDGVESADDFTQSTNNIGEIDSTQSTDNIVSGRLTPAQTSSQLSSVRANTVTKSHATINGTPRKCTRECCKDREPKPRVPTVRKRSPASKTSVSS